MRTPHFATLLTRLSQLFSDQIPAILWRQSFSIMFITIIIQYRLFCNSTAQFYIWFICRHGLATARTHQRALSVGFYIYLTANKNRARNLPTPTRVVCKTNWHSYENGTHTYARIHTYTFSCTFRQRARECWERRMHWCWCRRRKLNWQAKLGGLHCCCRRRLFFDCYLYPKHGWSGVC